MELEVHSGSADDWPTIIARSAPFIRGNSAEGVNWSCPCGRSLGVGLYRRQLLDILIECGACGLILESPSRTPGQPISGPCVYLESGKRYLIGGEIDVRDKPVQMVGYRSIVGHLQETGRSIPGLWEPHMPAVPSDLMAVLAEAPGALRGLLGGELERLEAADALGRASKTPPKERHRIIELIEFAVSTRSAIEQAAGGTTSIDGDLLAELITLRTCAARWSNHPEWPSLRMSLVSETAHTVILLAVASYLADANNGVGIHGTPTQQGAHTADLWIEPDLKGRLDLEVKAPLALRSPARPIAEPSAIRIVSKALAKSSRQRKSTRSNLLVIGGFHLGPSYEVVVSTAKAMLVMERRRWLSLAGIAIVDCTFEARSLAGAESLTPVLRVDFAMHPAYQGDVPVSVEQPRAAGIPESSP